MSIKILPYKIASESAKALAEVLGAKRLKENGNYRPKRSDLIINWGLSRSPERLNTSMATILNKPSAVNVAGNKLLTFQALHLAGVSIPEFTTNQSIAREWLERDGATVIERHNLRGSSGAGIRIVNLDDEDTESEIQAAPLYTKFIQKKAEFRVHVFQGRVIDYVQKRRVLAENRDDTYNPYISSMEHGWVFSRTDMLDLPGARVIAIKAVAALGLDFGAVDIMYANGKFYVLEVNCAPGLAGTTLLSYANAIRRNAGLSNLSEGNMDRPVIRQSVAPIVASVNRTFPSLQDQINRQLREQNQTVVLRLTRSESRMLLRNLEN